MYVCIYIYICFRCFFGALAKKLRVRLIEPDLLIQLLSVLKAFCSSRYNADRSFLSPPIPEPFNLC